MTPTNKLIILASKTPPWYDGLEADQNAAGGEINNKIYIIKQS